MIEFHHMTESHHMMESHHLALVEEVHFSNFNKIMAMSFIIRPAKVCYGIGDINCGRGTEDLSDCPCGGQSGTWNQVCSIGFETTKSVL